MNEQTDRQLLQETHDAVIQLTAVVLGTNGRGGLVGDIDEVRLSVKEMTLKYGAQSFDVARLLTKVPEIEKKVHDIDTELHEPEKGICDRMTIAEGNTRSTSRTIGWIIAGITALALTLGSLFLTHVF